MKCLACKSERIVETTTSYFVSEAGCYLIVENVPCQKCLQCGEEFFKASVLAEVEAIAACSAGGAEKVAVIDYKMPA